MIPLAAPLGHVQGIDVEGDSLWVSSVDRDAKKGYVHLFARDSSSLVQRRDKRTLGLQSEFEVKDHIGCIAAAATLIGGNWDSRVFYEWTRAGRELGQRPNPTPNAYQDLKRVGDRWVASGKLSKDEGAIDWLDDSLVLVKRLVTGKTDRGVLFSNEGMAIRDGKLYLLPEDGPSRLFVFRLPSTWAAE